MRHVLLPFVVKASLCRLGQGCYGLQHWVIFVLVYSRVRATDKHAVCLWLSLCGLTQLLYLLRHMPSPFVSKHRCAGSARDALGFSIGYYLCRSAVSRQNREKQWPCACGSRCAVDAMASPRQLAEASASIRTSRLKLLLGRDSRMSQGRDRRRVWFE